jgi:uncharacterized protein (DUF1800 family)
MGWRINCLAGTAALIQLLSSSSVKAQKYSDYLGAGHADGIKVTSSSPAVSGSGHATINGSGFHAARMEATRFLSMATLGFDDDDVDELLSAGQEAWLAQQIAAKPSEILPVMRVIWDEIYQKDKDAFGPYALHFNYAWWQTNLTNKDLVRQKVAYALSQILVTSINSDLGGWGECLSSYYDIFIRNAFGNYKDILTEVTLHPAMGYYLSHLNNPAEDVARNIHPDENYAREIMQLFTIGLVELNADGTVKHHADGREIPTYTNEDIKQLARVFTGLGGSKMANISWCPKTPEFGIHIYCLDKTSPLKMFGWAHQKGPKEFLNFRLPGKDVYSDDEAMREVTAAIDFLFKHPNIAPFISYRLIQRLTTSNPSPEYVGRVAAVFADNGQGVRGDLGAVVSAILLDKEAGWEQAWEQDHASRLREPMLRYTQLSRAFMKVADRDRYWNNGYNYLDVTRQHVMAAPSVFNFYLPDYQPVGDMAGMGLVAPEFKLHNTSTSVGYINAVHAWTFWNSLMYSWEGSEGNPDGVRILTNDLEAIADDSETLINRLDILLVHGQLSQEVRNLLRNTLNAMFWTSNQEWRYWRVRLAIYLIMISPDYNCVK